MRAGDGDAQREPAAGAGFAGPPSPESPELPESPGRRVAGSGAGTAAGAPGEAGGRRQLRRRWRRRHARTGAVADAGLPGSSPVGTGLGGLASAAFCSTGGSVPGGRPVGFTEGTLPRIGKHQLTKAGQRVEIPDQRRRPAARHRLLALRKVKAEEVGAPDRPGDGRYARIVSSLPLTAESGMRSSASQPWSSSSLVQRAADLHRCLHARLPSVVIGAVGRQPAIEGHILGTDLQLDIGARVAVGIDKDLGHLLRPQLVVVLFQVGPDVVVGEAEGQVQVLLVPQRAHRAHLRDRRAIHGVDEGTAALGAAPGGLIELAVDLDLRAFRQLTDQQAARRRRRGSQRRQLSGDDAVLAILPATLNGKAGVALPQPTSTCALSPPRRAAVRRDGCRE